MRRILIGFVSLLMVAAVAGALVVRHLEGNVHTVKLSGNSRSIGSSDGKPLNILLIGSDTRSSKEDCKIGGACAGSTPTAVKGSEATGNADVEMLLHVSADRKHAEVVSIPRDTITDIPDCTGPDGNVVKARRDRVNSALTAGPECSVRTVSALTGITIPHVAVVDFAGVITLTNALGGVPVCVSDDVYDPYSHLKLSKGEHQVQGASALAFLRTRHSFGDGSDIGRSRAQHLFMNSLIRSLRSAGTLSDPVKLYNVADAATKALTVDKGLAGVSSIKDLYNQLNKVPSNDIAFSTMPNVPDPSNPNVVLPAPRAAALFERLRNDTWPTATPKSLPSGGPISSSTSTPAAPTSTATAEVDRPDETTAKQCAQVATARAVTINGVTMTPTQAYAQSPSVPDSAP